MNSFFNSLAKGGAAHIGQRLFRSIPGNSLRIGIAAAIIVGTICWLAYTGYGANKSYYVTIAELGGLGDKAYHNQLRVEGFVQPGTIVQDGPHVTFVLNEFESHSPQAAAGRLLKVAYNGSEPPPDTFKDNAQALAGGTYGRDGVFHATTLQAKCASKYAPVQPGSQPGSSPGATPQAPAGAKPATASGPAQPGIAQPGIAQAGIAQAAPAANEAAD
jgi:cytochrome c-type biogenesis protein CcmE